MAISEYPDRPVRAQFCVVGGGLSGMCAAIAAARHGVDTVLIHDRPVLGGNASSEIRMWVCGAHGMMETGIIEEIRLENLRRNPNQNYSIWDTILYEKVRFQPNLRLFLNTSCNGVEMEGERIRAVRAWQMTTQRNFRVEADYFADCSGDSVLAPLTGAEYRYGREGRSEFGESIAPEKPDARTMGMSCLIQAREMTEPQKFIAPEWAYRFDTDEELSNREHVLDQINNFWWLELGGENDAIGDTEEIRDELLRVAYGIWDHIKNRGDHGADNWALEWVGFLPGKRESRRYVGDHIITQNDVASGGKFPDTVAYGGWTMDDHHPGGFRYPGNPNIFHPAPSPYGIPYRSLYSRNIDNLWFAGRNLSATHCALSSTRVMATCALLGQAVGSAAAVAVRHGLSPRGVYTGRMAELQRLLMEDDCFLPGFRREISEAARSARLRSSNGGDPSGLLTGIDRVYDGCDNCWNAAAGDRVEYEFDRLREVTEVRVTLDSDLFRNNDDNDHLNVPCNYPLKMKKFSISPLLIEAFRVEGRTPEGKVVEVMQVAENFQRFHHLRLKEPLRLTGLRLVVEKCRKPGTSRVFAFDFVAS